MSEVCTLKMSLEMSLALNDLLMGLKPKGRSQIREHKHLFKSMRENCCNEKKTKNAQGNDDVQHVYKIEGSELKIERKSALEYLRDSLRDKMNDGIPAYLSIGYCDLDEAVEEAMK
jgi:hypothetical protein